MRQNTLFKSVPILLCLTVWFIELVSNEILNRVHLTICNIFIITYRIITNKYWGKYPLEDPKLLFAPLDFCALSIHFKNPFKANAILCQRMCGGLVPGRRVEWSSPSKCL